MVLLRCCIFMMTWSITSMILYAEPLDALLTELATPKNSEQQSPQSPIMPEANDTLSPKVIDETEPKSLIFGAKEPQEDQVKNGVQDNNLNIALSPKTELTPSELNTPLNQPKRLESPVPSIMPKTVVNPAEVQPVRNLEVPGPLSTPKIIGAPTPIVAQAQTDVSTSDENVKMQLTDVHEITPLGLSTLNVDNGGNWLEKRIWYKKAEQLFEDIRITVQKASDIRMKFVHEVNQVGQHIDEFYETVSFQKGQIEELLQVVALELTTEKNIRGGDLSSQEREIRLKIQSDQQLFQSIIADFKLIEDLDDQIDKTMMKAFKEIDACRAFETKAWNNFKDIGMELDDKKARVMYYEMENFNKNIEQKLQYLQHNLLQYLQMQLTTKVSQTMNQIKASVQNLYSKGLDLQSLLQKNEQGDFIVLQQRDNAKALSDEKTEKLHSDKHDVKNNSAQHSKKSQDMWYHNVWCSILEYLKIIFCKIQQWATIVVCCVQTVVCKIYELICKLFGY